MSYLTYVKQLAQFVLSSSLVLGVLVGAVFLVTGEGSMNIDMDFDFGALDGLSAAFGIPLVAVVLFTLLSPVSFWIHRLWARP